MKRTFNREEKYTGFDNQKVVDLTRQYEKLKQQQGAVWFEIQKIYDNCDHQYKFVCSGPYEDFYRCSICGHEIEH
jgi:hypothetical protein